MNEFEVFKEVLNQRIEIPCDGSTYYTVFKKTGEGKWESCGEFIDNEEDAVLFAASPALLRACRRFVHDLEHGLVPIGAIEEARAAISRATRLSE
jgi:hypothetical protein